MKMTENEAIKTLKIHRVFNNGSNATVVAIDIAVKALQEIQQYRAIGAVEDLINRKFVIEEIDKLINSPYAKSPQFGAERKEVMETVKILCVEKAPIKIEEELATYEPVSGKFYYGQQLYIKKKKEN